MPTTRVLSPLRQFSGKERLIDRIRESLTCGRFQDVRFAVAYAKSGPLERLLPTFASWRAASGSNVARIVVGIDQKGTSVQALRLALAIFDEVYISNTPSSSTFHPKLYLFLGGDIGRAIVGSHNLTVGGTETNFEAGVELDYALPSEQADFDPFVSAWSDLPFAPFTKPLTPALLAQLSAMGLLMDESTSARGWAIKRAAIKATVGVYPFPLIHPAPPSALPKHSPSLSHVTPAVKAKSAASGALPVPPTPAPVAVLSPAFLPTSLVIQIVPHHNGEVFLSKTAVNQNPAFFGFPFTGTTTTKLGAPGYPQRTPDPCVDINVYDGAGALAFQRLAYSLNTVFYQLKGEIRITVSPDIRAAIQPFSIMHMLPTGGGTDYLLEIYNPGSPRYAALLDVCNQTLPSGGGVARRMGWL